MNGRNGAISPILRMGRPPAPATRTASSPWRRPCPALGPRRLSTSSTSAPLPLFRLGRAFERERRVPSSLEVHRGRTRRALVSARRQNLGRTRTRRTRNSSTVTSADNRHYVNNSLNWCPLLGYPCHQTIPTRGAEYGRKGPPVRSDQLWTPY